MERCHVRNSGMQAGRTSRLMFVAELMYLNPGKTPYIPDCTYRHTYIHHPSLRGGESLAMTTCRPPRYCLLLPRSADGCMGGGWMLVLPGAMRLCLLHTYLLCFLLPATCYIPAMANRSHAHNVSDPWGSWCAKFERQSEQVKAVCWIRNVPQWHVT